jgi:Integrase core domain
VSLTLAQLKATADSYICDLVVGKLPELAMEVKLARFGRDNGTDEDAAIKKILSPYPEGRSAYDGVSADQARCRRGDCLRWLDRVSQVRRIRGRRERLRATRSPERTCLDRSPVAGESYLGASVGWRKVLVDHQRGCPLPGHRGLEQDLHFARIAGVETFPHTFVAGVVLTGVQIPRMNAIMERWVQTCRRELLDRTLIWNHRHLIHALREFEQFYNTHRPHQGLANARPLRPLPTPITHLGETTPLHIRRHDRLSSGILHEYEHAA